MYSGPSPSEIKDVRQNMGLSCTTCFKAGQGFKRCDRCKISFYCSKECQKKDWPRHKQFCKETEGFGMTKLLENLMGNKLLYVLLQIMLILEFDLLNNPKLLREPFMARIDVAMEPVKLEDLRSLIKSKDLSKKMEGMLQFTNIISPRSGGSNLPLTPMRQELWNKVRQGEDAAGNYSNPVGLVEFVNDSVQSTTVSVFISHHALRMVKDKSLALIQAAENVSIPKPMTVHTCMEYINSVIRFDTENRWLLRKLMRDSDKQIICNVSKDPKTFSALYFQGKMKRESIYGQP